MYKVIFAGLLLIGISGCSTVPSTDNGKTSYAYEVMDKESITFDEIIVGHCYSSGTETKIVNTHIVLTAILNPSSLNEMDMKPSSSYLSSDVHRIVQSTFPRISAKLVEYVQNQNRDVPNLLFIRGQLPQIASDVFNPIFSKWKDAGKYKVEFVVTSIYCTNGSVGRTASARTTWW